MEVTEYSQFGVNLDLFCFPNVSQLSPFNVMRLSFFVLAFMIFVLLLMMLRPSCVDTVFSSSVCSCIC